MALVYCATSVARSPLPPPQWGNFVVQTDEALSLSVCVCVYPAGSSGFSCSFSQHLHSFGSHRCLVAASCHTHTHDALLITWLIAAHNGRAVNLSLFVCVPCVCVFTPVVVSPCPCVCLQQRRPYWPCLGCFFVCLPVAATHAYVLPADFPSDCNCFEEQLVTHTDTDEFSSSSSHTDWKIERETIPSSSLC